MKDSNIGSAEVRALSVYTRVTIIGFLLTVLALLIGTVMNLIESNTDSLVFTIPSMAIPLIVVGLVWRFGKWALIVAAIIALLSFLVNSAYIPYGLGNPNSFFDFLPALLVVFGFILAFFGAIASFIQRRADTPRTTATVPERSSLVLSQLGFGNCLRKRLRLLPFFRSVDVGGWQPWDENGMWSGWKGKNETSWND